MYEISRQRIEQLGISFGFIFLFFPIKVAGALQLHADLSVYPKFWGYQVFIYSGYCSCHCQLPSEESTSGIPLI